MTTQILVVKPKTLTAADKKLLRDAGVVCIESNDPASVRLLTPEGPALGCNDLFRCAMEAIAGDKYNGNTQETFKRVAAMVKASGGISP